MSWSAEVDPMEVGILVFGAMAKMWWLWLVLGIFWWLMAEEEKDDRAVQENSPYIDHGGEDGDQFKVIMKEPCPPLCRACGEMPLTGREQLETGVCSSHCFLSWENRINEIWQMAGRVTRGFKCRCCHEMINNSRMFSDPEDAICDRCEIVVVRDNSADLGPGFGSGLGLGPGPAASR